MNRRTINRTSQCREAYSSACTCDRTPFPGRPDYRLSQTMFTDIGKVLSSNYLCSKEKIESLSLYEGTMERSWFEFIYRHFLS